MRHFRSKAGFSKKAARSRARLCVFFTLAANIAMLGGCSDLPPLPSVEAAPYQLGVGDEIRILTYGDEHLSGTFRVGDGGTIDMPLLGNVVARGKTTADLEHEIADELRDRQLIKNASVAVQIQTYRPVFILGEVSKPGRYPYEPGMTALTVVAAAGGFTYRAKQEQVKIERVIASHPVQGLAPSTSLIEPADVITVRERYF